MASLTLAGCGGGSESEIEGGEGAAAGASEAGTEAAAEGPAGEPELEDDGGAPGADTIKVFMDEYIIEVPDTLPAGPAVILVQNVGFEEHNFEIHQGDSLLWEFPLPLNPAQSRVMEPVLDPGSYVILCTVSGHDGRGMREVLTVVPR